MYSQQRTINEPNEDMEKVELFFSCRNLIDMDTFTKSDPQIRLYQRTQQGWNLVDKTEIIWDNLNPDFAKSFTLDYIFEIQQTFKVEVVDIDSGDETDFIGECEFELGELMGSKNNMLILNLNNSKARNNSGGKCIIRAETVQKQNDYIHMQFKVSN